MALLVLLAAWNIHSVCAEEVHVACDKIVGLIRPLQRFPYVPADPSRLDQDCYEAFNIQVHGLVRRFTATGGQSVTATEPAEILVWEMHAAVSP